MRVNPPPPPITWGIWRKRYKDRNAALHYKRQEDYAQYSRYFDKRQKEREPLMTWNKRQHSEPGETFYWGVNLETGRYEWIRSKTHEIDKVTDDHVKYTYDELVEMFGIKRVESINFKQHSDCKLFRCLVCWLLIHPDDDILEYKEGFIHRLCHSK